MPTDVAPPPPPSGAPDPGEEAARQEEALFRALLTRVRASNDKVHLQERCDAALRLVLNRDEDRPTRDQLIADIAMLVETLPETVSDGPGREAFEKTVDACLGLLSSAEQKRVGPARVMVPSQPQLQTQPVAAPAGHSSADGTASHDKAAHQPAGQAHRFERRKERSGSLFGMIGMLVVIVGAGLAIGLRDRGDSGARPLVVQMEAATRGSIPASNIFGGSLRVTSQGGHLAVMVEGIPASECVASGWDLVRKGVLTINGVTPPRISAAKINDLCHEEDVATLIWVPKDK